MPTPRTERMSTQVAPVHGAGAPARSPALVFYHSCCRRQGSRAIDALAPAYGGARAEVERPLCRLTRRTRRRAGLHPRALSRNCKSDIILIHAFSANGDDGSSPLNVADCPSAAGDHGRGERRGLAGIKPRTFGERPRHACGAARARRAAERRGDLLQGRRDKRRVHPSRASPSCGTGPPRWRTRRSGGFVWPKRRAGTGASA